MAKTTQHLKPDIALKNYWRDNDRFADFFNAVLFQGKQIIRPDELEDLDTEESSIIEHKKYTESIQASRDTIKIRKKSTAFGIEFVMLGKESQAHIHYAMPMRVMGYDYAAYKKQYDSNAQKYQTSDEMEPDEFLSRMKKTDKFIPVITVVVYYGENEWDGATSLHDMLRIPAEIAAYVNDYKIILVEARKNELVLHNTNNVDFFNLLAILLNKDIPRNKARQRAILYDNKHKPDKSVITAVAGATNSRISLDTFEKGADHMFMDSCTSSFLRSIAEEGILEGRAQGIIELGYEVHLSEDDILERLQRKLNVSIQTAQEYLNQFKK